MQSSGVGWPGSLSGELEPEAKTAASIESAIPASHPLPSSLISLAVEAQTEDVVRPEVFFVPPAQSSASERIGCRVDVAYIHAAQKLIESGHFGWSTISDFIRWTVEAGIQIAIRHLKDENMSNEARVMRAILRRHQVRQRNETYAQMMGMVVRDIRDMMQAGQEGDARQEFERTLKDIDSLNVRSLEERLKATLIQEFPGLWGEVVGPVPAYANSTPGPNAPGSTGVPPFAGVWPTGQLASTAPLTGQTPGTPVSGVGTSIRVESQAVSWLADDQEQEP